MELTPSPLAVAVYKLFERLETEYSQNRPTQCKHFDLNFSSAFAQTNLFRSIKNVFSFHFVVSVTRTVLDKDLLELYGLFGDQLQTALDIIDRDKIKVFRRASDNRQYVRIFPFFYKCPLRPTF